MTPAKRVFDIVLALVLLALFLLVLPVLLAVIALGDGRPFFYVSERMKTPQQGFRLWKFRTMSVVAPSENAGVSGGDKAGRVTPVGKFLRRTRLDELPQLWNILKGDMSFVGPRPPLRHYVETCPETYRAVLKNRPGVTGLATLVFHAHEERLLAACKTPAETERTYLDRCVARKARLDLIYQSRRNLCFDIVLLARTLGKMLP